MKKAAAVLLVLVLAIPALADNKETDRLKEAGTVLKEILNIPDNIPQELLDKAECVVVLPGVKKGAIGIGASYGRGAMVCRTGASYTGAWGAPVMVALEGLNIGFQLGGQATDFILLVMNKRGAEGILGSKLKLSGDMAAAAGPKGRAATAGTDASMRAEILAYSRSRGAFAGVSIEGSTLRPDGGANERVYGRKVDAKAIVRGGSVPGAAQTLVSTLRQHSPVNKSEPKSLQ